MTHYIPLTGVMLSDEAAPAPTMGRCRDCQSWRQDDISPDYQAADDLASEQPDSWGVCVLTQTWRDRPVDLRTLAFAAHGDYESKERAAVLLTAEGFGCVQFAPKV